jgi:thiamine pyrophosphokinase
MFLIVAGGEPPGSTLLRARAREAAMLIAADRGARYCLDAGVTPGLVVGDMDSLDHEMIERLAASGVEVKRFSADKDKTDTEIAFDEAVLRGAKRIEILGALGGRLDHALANIHLLYAALRRGIAARIVSETQQVFLVDSSAAFTESVGRTVSFLPLTERVEGITLEGFRYELANASMEMGKPCGVSNVVEGEEARLTLKSGILIALVSMA